MAKKKLTPEQVKEKERAYAREYIAKKTLSGQDIGPIPPVKDWARRLSCRLDLARFIKTYLAKSFPKPFAPDHLTALAKAEQAVLHGGLFAQAAPRGDGKSERCKATALWATLYGHRRFPLLIGATGGHAAELLDGIRAYLDGAGVLKRDEHGSVTGVDPGPYHLLLEDFPEIVYPIVALEGETKRQKGQRCQGQRTKIHWGGRHITFPTVPAGNWIDGKTTGIAPGAGARFYATGITGRIRGFNVDGERPELVIPDDPQTDESAASPNGNAKIEKILGGPILGVAGPGKKISGIMPCTVIRRGDAIDRILSHELHPEWDSTRTKMLYRFPARMEIDPQNMNAPCWEHYHQLKINYDPHGDPGDKHRAEREATLYYLEHHEALSEGAEVAWPERFSEDKLDALQEAMDLFYQNRQAFFAEYQNEPEEEKAGNVVEQTAEQIAARTNGLTRGIVPFEATRLTAFVDVQQTLLYWVLCAWADDFSGWVVDYGTFPKQNRPYYTLADAMPTLAQATGVSGLEAQLKVGLTQLTNYLVRGWPRDRGGEVRIDQLLIDSGHQADVVYHFCRNTPFAALTLPSKGIGVTSSKPRGIAEGKLNPGDRRGLNWLLPAAKESRGVRLLLYDTNAWKSHIHERLAVGVGLPGALSFPGKEPHRMLADHLTSEYRSRITNERTGRTVDEWTARPERADNHFFDCLVGCAVAASMHGVALDGVHKPATTPKKIVKTMEQLKAEARARAKR